MKSYALGQSIATHALVRRLLPVFVLTSLIAAGMGWLVGWFANADAEAHLHGILIIILMSVFSCWLLWRRKVRELKSYRIVLDGEELIRVVDGYSDVVIRQNEITTILERVGQGLAIRTNDPRKVIWVPVSLEGYEELRNLLANVCPIEFLSPNASLRGLIWRLMGMAATVIITVPTLLIAFFSDNRYAVAPAALFSIVLLVGCVILLRRSPFVDRATKAASWVIFFPLLSIIARLIWALFYSE